MNEIQKQFKKMVKAFMSDDMDINEITIDAKMAELRMLPTYSSLKNEEIEEVGAEIKSEMSIKLDKGSLVEQKKHEKWFLTKKAELEMRYWSRYRQYLINDKNFATGVVNKMDDILDTLTDLLGDPSANAVYSRRGLIIGDVQSGKTANYIGLMCKAADAGYKVIVLLTGTIEKLRQQTQQRVDEGFVGADSNVMIKNKTEGLYVGVGRYDKTVSTVVLTSVDSDFKAQNAKNLNFDLKSINGTVVFVVKKNSGVLKRLNKWLSTYNKNDENAISQSLLVIDDEADNASVNTKKEQDETPTAINGEIRKMLKMFEKSSYVGFTATPYANIFIDPDTENEMYADDLFPRDYIYSLNAPSNYIGARNIFSENGSNSNMLVAIDDNIKNQNSIALLLPQSHKNSIQVQKLPKDMETAINTFILANAIEDLRGIKKNHRSMLINVSRFTLVQKQIADLVNDYLKKMQSAIKIYAGLEESVALRNSELSALNETYYQIYSNISEEYEWSEIQKTLYRSSAGIMVQMFNIEEGQKFSYDDYKDGVRVIAVGGMSLSRGLTLEGLVVSYFYRNSKMYDTLMQMGRWFGYRDGYNDVCKIFMSEDSIEWYRYISEATDELRKDVKKFEDSGLTPNDFGLRVKSDMATLMITAANKMRSAESRKCAISFNSVVIETPEIYADEDMNLYNEKEVEEFVDELTSAKYQVRKEVNGKVGFVNVAKKMIMEFLERIQVSPKNAYFDIKTINDFIGNYEGEELELWDVAFASGKSSHVKEFGNGIRFNCIERSFTVVNDGKILKMSGSKKRLGSAMDGEFGLTEEQKKNIEETNDEKALSQKDCFLIKRNPLLTIYFIELKIDDKKQNLDEIKKAVNKYKDKEVIGFSIGIPRLENSEAQYAKYMLNKVAIRELLGEEDVDEGTYEEE
ncbi:Z1 domain-containing protein [Falcatimonas sp. MSJ-15]|uniref:Z1 domain-containing protein n=1 Tax=Falcatimonas sp. MSJ-15 TaxID=2841515 RepID=UPI001C10C780|nr:Z1 domain-containing protein [Falcatimonas sp. MSJ-15]MBU5470558.1 Z1 domain-containing protein [Falcatimonas sp. MSJ-15]